MKSCLSNQDWKDLAWITFQAQRCSRPDPTMKGANSSSFLSASSDLQLRNLAVLPSHAFLNCHLSLTWAIPLESRELSDLQYQIEFSKYSQPCLDICLRRSGTHPHSCYSFRGKSTERLQFHQQLRTGARSSDRLLLALTILMILSKEFRG